MLTRLYTCLVCLLFAFTAAGQLTPAPYASVGGYFAYDFKAAKNDVRAQSRIHAGIVGHKSITKRVLMEAGLGYCKYQRNLFIKDSLFYPADGYYDYTYRLHSIEALFNIKFNVLVMSRGNDEYKIYPVVGLGAGYAFAESKRPNGTRDVAYNATNDIWQYFVYSFKAGFEVEGAYSEPFSFTWGFYYHYNRYAVNTLLNGDNHNVQIQVRAALNFEKKPRKIALE
jgi:hypothetical protein